jgi:integrase
MAEFRSKFSAKLATFLDFRAARGFKRETYLPHLLKFDRWCAEQRPEYDNLKRELVHDWIDDDNASAYEISYRAKTMRQLGKYLGAIGEDVYILPDKYAPIKSPSVPYIFTDLELTSLFAAIDMLPPKKNEPFLNEIIPTLFRLTYTCGLRPNESRELLTDNVNLNTGEILVTRTKLDKERLVVMSKDMLELANKYDLRRRVFGNDNEYFFPSASGGAIKSDTIHSAFNKAWSNADLPSKYPQKVRVYDLRHRFASACLNRWLDDGENLMAMLPFLREYMGHKSLSATAYYVHILPENIVKSSAIDWDRLNSMFPEVAK